MTRKITLKNFCFVLLCAFSYSLNAQIIFTNGPISTGATSTSATAAPTGYTWSELQTPNTSLGASAFYATTVVNDFSLADDFVVPAGQTWNITSVNVFGYQTNHALTTIPIDVLRIRIWNGDPALGTSTVVFGNMTTNVLNTAASGDALVYRTAAATNTARKVWSFNANVATSLTAGTYWIEYQVHAINDGSIFFPPVTILNTLSSPTWNAKQRNAAAWANLTDGGSLNTLAAPFELNGTVLGIDSKEFSSNITLYPNPANNLITISDGTKSSDGLVEIYDITGRMVKTLNSSFDSDVAIDISNFSSGNYILKLKSENGIAVKKFLKL